MKERNDVPAPEGCVWVRVYAELNDHLPREQRHRSVRFPVREGADIAEILRCAGIPAGDVDLVLVNGDSVPLSFAPRSGDRLAAYPVFDSFDVSELQRIRDHPLRRPRFVLDVHLGKLARLLRMLGFDAAYNNSATDHYLVESSLKEDRVLLSRDRALVSRKELQRAFHVSSQQPLLQLVEIVRRLDLSGTMAPFSRCLQCNTPLKEVPKEAVAAELPPRVCAAFEDFRRCETCERVYWRGSHHERMERLVLHIREKCAILPPVSLRVPDSPSTSSRKD
jgi:hypothetical protein